MKYKLVDVASVIRSKNSGPYELTFDVIFKDFEVYQKVKAAGIFNEKMFAKLYGIEEKEVMGVVHLIPPKQSKPRLYDLSHRDHWGDRRVRCPTACTAHDAGV